MKKIPTRAKKRLKTPKSFGHISKGPTRSQMDLGLPKGHRPHFAGLPKPKPSYHKSGITRTQYGPRLRGPKGAGQYGTHPYEKLMRIPT